MYIFIYYNHISIHLSKFYIYFIYFFCIYKHIFIPLSKSYIAYMYIYMYIYEYYDHICMPSFKVFI